ncbi:MAG TPA: xanthine dehydrogenase molybdopterin binding subunit, partial [Paracoccus sp.]|nr:xanthine dehydrogenase molybdopterin binding subunit [Paracoccus sp. (in: a-proteobacteria)]
MKDDTTIRGLAHSETAHDSAIKHVTGRADYTDDLPEPQGLIHAYLGLSECAHGRITGMDFTDTLAHPGVLGVLTAADLPGVNDVSPNGKHDDPVFAQDHVLFWGQPVFAVVAESRDQARRAAQKAQIEYEALPFALDPIAARDAGHDYVTDPLTLRRGDARAAMATAPRRIKGRFGIGGQDHFYLEGQIAMAVPGEDEDVVINVSTQHPSEVQHMVAHVLDVPSHSVVVNVRRMG